jgi:hypothetical protein
MNMNEDPTLMRSRAVFEEEQTLPHPKRERAICEDQRLGRARDSCAEMSRHVIWPLCRVGVAWISFRSDALKPSQHVLTHGWVSVLSYD